MLLRCWPRSFLKEVWRIISMHNFVRLRRVGCALLVGALIILLQLSAVPQARLRPNGDTVVLPGHLPPSLSGAKPIRRVDAGEPVPLALTLSLRHQALLEEVLTHL